MRACTACGQENPDEANFCLRCGAAFSTNTEAPPEAAAESVAEAATDAATATPAVGDAPPSDEVAARVSEHDLWQAFIGPSKAVQFSMKDGWSWRPAYYYYARQFQQFQTSGGPGFAVTWHWPAVLLDSFLWFLYRKMYMFAAVYAIGPVLSSLIFGDWSVGIVWQIGAGVSANYLYFWHVKDTVEKIRAQTDIDAETKIRILQEEGGIQPYVLWLGAALHVLKLVVIMTLMSQGLPGDESAAPREPMSDTKFF